MTFQIVLNSLKQGIKHVDCLSTPCFLIEDAPSIVVTCVLPVATCSNMSYTLSSSNRFCNFSGGAFTELRRENPVALSLLRESLLSLFWLLRPDQNDHVTPHMSCFLC